MISAAKIAKKKRMMTENEPALVRTALRSGPGIGEIVVDAAITIHKALVSGLYEIVYEVEALEGPDRKPWGFNSRV